MNEVSHERDKLPALVRDLGREMEQRAPSFEAMWRAAQANPAGDAKQRHGPARRTWLAAVGLAGAACVAIMVYHHLSTQAPMKPLEHKSDPGSEWALTLDPESPTDFLLAGTGAPEGGRVEKLSREISDLLQP